MNMTDNEKVIRRLYDITSNHEKGFPEQTRELLAMGCERLGLEIGILSQIDYDRYRVVHQVCPEEVPLEDDVQFHLPNTYCAVTIAANQPVGYEHVGKSELSNHPAYAEFELESYIGIPVVVDGSIYGTLNFSSPFARERKFSEIDIDALKLMALWIAGELSRQNFQQKILQQAKQLEETNARLLAMTKTDSLTQVGNRHSFFEELEAHLKLSQRVSMPLSVIMFDLDDFKSYNDNYGHVAGDEALVEVAASVARLARTTDYVARYGGEEFMVLLPDTDFEKSLITAERIRQAVASIDSLQCAVSSSFGISTYEPQKCSNRDYRAVCTKLVEQADKALYYSKDLGKNCVNHFASIGSDNALASSA